jgi:heme exporter protein C
MITRYANPHRFMKIIISIRPFAFVLAAVAGMTGLYFAFFASPPDYQQGETVRIMYIHVPAAWMAMFVYTTMAVSALVGLVWKHVVAEVYAKSAALLGAAFTLICLVTGSLWGKPMWGTWWVWDARLTSVFILFLLYVGYIILVDSFDDEQKGMNAGAMLLLAGAVNIPVIKFSVDWWNTLHQPSSILRMEGIAIDASMLWPLLLMVAAFKLLFIGLVCLRMETEMIRRRLRIQGSA